MSDKKFDFNEFISEALHSLQDPKGYFSALKTTGGYEQPLIKALIFGLLSGVIYFIWALTGLGMVSMGLLGVTAGPMVIITSAIGAIIGLFIGAVILLIISSIAGGNTDFEANVRVTAPLMVLMPVGALLAVLNFVSFTLGSLIGLLVNVYGLWMLYHALTQSLKAKENIVKIIILVLVALVLFTSLIAIITGKVVSKAASYPW